MSTFKFFHGVLAISGLKFELQSQYVTGISFPKTSGHRIGRPRFE
jgi:hypothetical protein